MDKIRTVILEDNRLLREGLTAMLEEQPDLHVVASFGDNDKIMPRIHDANAHLLLLDLGLRNHNSLKIAKTVKKELPSTKVVAMDLVPAQEDIYEFVQAGVSGFILKDATVSNFLKTIRSVVQGINVLPLNLTESLFSQIVLQAVLRAETPKIVEESIRMTKRERQVMALIADGMTNKEIGTSLHLSTYTVKSHVHNILEKLALRSRLQIANYAHTNDEFSIVANSVSLLGE